MPYSYYYLDGHYLNRHRGIGDCDPFLEFDYFTDSRFSSTVQYGDYLIVFKRRAPRNIYDFSVILPRFLYKISSELLCNGTWQLDRLAL